MAYDDFDLGGLTGRGSTRRRKSGGGSGGVATLSRDEARRMLRRLTPEPVKVDLGSDETLASLGEGGKRAARVLAQIEDSSAPESVKAEARRIYEGSQEGKKKKKGLGRVLGAAGDVVDGVLTVLDKPKRAVVATLQEGAEQISGNEDGKSWADNVLRERSYGFGDALRENPGLANLNPIYFAATTAATAGLEPAQDAQGWMDRQLEGKWGGRTAGLAGDILLDPLTYLTFGASKVGAVGRGVDEGADAARVLAAGQKVRPKEAARLLSAAGLDEAASAVLRANSTMAATADELAEAGLRGGMNFAGKQVLPHDLVRALGGRGVARAKSGVAGTNTMASLRKVFGGSDELRTLLRAGDGVDPIRALKEMDSGRTGTLKGYRLSGVMGDQLEDLRLATKKAKVSGEDIARALRSGPESREFQALDAAADGLASKWAAWFEEARVSANEMAGRDFIARRQNYVPRIPGEDAKGLLGRSSSEAPRGGRSWFEREALKPGMEWRGRVLTDAEPIEDQLFRIAQEDFGDQAVDLFENDILKIAPIYLRGLQNRVGEMATIDRLGQLGVVRPRPAAEGATAALDDLGAAASADRALERAATRLRAQAGVGGGGPLRAELDRIATTRAGLASRYGRALPDEVVRRFGDADRAAAEIGSLTTQFDGNSGASRIVSQGFSTTRDDLELRVMIGEEAVQAAPNARQADALREAVRLRREAMDIAEGAQQFSTQQGRYVAALEIQRLEMEALGHEMGFLNVTVDDALKRLDTPEARQALTDMLNAGLQSQYRMFGLSPGYKSTAELGLRGSEEVPADTLARLLKAQEAAKAPHLLLRSIDAANRGFKTYALMSPGFHVRNSIGGTFNNYVAGMSSENYMRFAKSAVEYKAVKAGKITEAAVKDPSGYAAVKQLADSGLFDDLNRVADMADNPNVRRFKDIVHVPNKKRILTDNPVSRASRYTGDKVEDMLRGSLAFDRLVKGGSLDSAIDDVYTYHFNYGDLSDFEKNVARRIIPFWTWTSRNLGHQVEFLLSNPKAYQRWNNVRDFLAPEEGGEGVAVPPYLQGPGTAQLDKAIPFLGGEFLQPGIPIEATDETLRAFGRNPIAALAQDSAPFIKVPLERQFEEQFFGGIPLSDKQEPVPEAWARVPGMLRALESQGVVQKDRYGEYTVSAKDAYTIEQGMPTLGRIRRLFPSEKKYQERATTSWLSFLGLGSRAVGDQTRESEMYRRLDEITKVRDRAYDAGYTDVKPPRN